MKKDDTYIGYYAWRHRTEIQSKSRQSEKADIL